MKDPRNLSKRELADIVQSVRNWLWLTEGEKDSVMSRYGKTGKKIVAERNALGECCTVSYFDPDNEHDADILDGVTKVLEEYGLQPDRVCPVSTAYTYDRWGDDEVQFARLLEELVGIGILDFLKDKGWKDLEASMDLKREQIMKVFDRAQKRWDLSKKDLKEEKKG